MSNRRRLILAGALILGAVLAGSLVTHAILTAHRTASRHRTHIILPVNIDAHWSSDFARGDGAGPGASALCFWRGDLYVAGEFHEVGEDGASYIARWDGSGWRAVGGGTDGPVHALLVFDGDLVAAGSFELAGGRPAHAVARWDGSRWSPIGRGLFAGEHTADIAALGTHGSRLVAAGRVMGGESSNDEGVGSQGIAEWDGRRWRGLGWGLSGAVWLVDHAPAPGPVFSAMAELHGDLLVGGAIGSSRDTPTPGLARWDGHAWHGFGDDLVGEVYAFLPDAKGLIAAGDIRRVGAQTAHNIVQWNGHAWSPLGVGLPGRVTALAHLGDLVVAAGRFTHVDADSAGGLAVWDGVQWKPFGAGLRGAGTQIASLAATDTSLWVAGQFDSLGGVANVHMARWDAHPLVVASAGSTPGPTMEFHMTAGGGPLWITYRLPESAHVKLTMENWSGLPLRVLVDETRTAGSGTVAWNGETTNGAYVLRGRFIALLEVGKTKISRTLDLPQGVAVSLLSSGPLLQMPPSQSSVSHTILEQRTVHDLEKGQLGSRGVTDVGGLTHVFKSTADGRVEELWIHQSDSPKESVSRKILPRIRDLQAHGAAYLSGAIVLAAHAESEGRLSHLPSANQTNLTIESLDHPERIQPIPLDTQGTFGLSLPAGAYVVRDRVSLRSDRAQAGGLPFTFDMDAGSFHSLEIHLPPAPR